MKKHSGPADRPRLGQANLSVMKPAFNEERTLEIILGHVLERPEVGEVIVIDVGSTDQKMPMISSCAM
jgi:cellulose synthase/poly-beta-1,6-N-acetylglucosamine synthase-like glycosyltransferase